MEIEIYGKEFVSCNILRAEVGTNCPQGGDTGHGGRTILRLIDEAATDISIKVDGQPLGSIKTLEILLGGDTECDTFMNALNFALNVLKDHNPNYEMDPHIRGSGKGLIQKDYKIETL